eukprot:m.397472 g.397472  ORF g.397472 m.397472 type:complete len:124 (+) comp21130_c0_seq1:2666-3037(+)
MSVLLETIRDSTCHRAIRCEEMFRVWVDLFPVPGCSTEPQMESSTTLVKSSSLGRNACFFFRVMQVTDVASLSAVSFLNLQRCLGLEDVSCLQHNYWLNLTDCLAITTDRALLEHIPHLLWCS